jgi:hypothetical protein
MNLPVAGIIRSTKPFRGSIASKLSDAEKAEAVRRLLAK